LGSLQNWTQANGQGPDQGAPLLFLYIYQHLGRKKMQAEKYIAEIHYSKPIVAQDCPVRKSLGGKDYCPGL